MKVKDDPLLDKFIIWFELKEYCPEVTDILDKSILSLSPAAPVRIIVSFETSKSEIITFPEAAAEEIIVSLPWPVFIVLPEFTAVDITSFLSPEIIFQEPETNGEYVTNSAAWPAPAPTTVL